VRMRNRPNANLNDCPLRRDYFDLFFGLCWFSVETSSLADGGTGTTPWRTMSFAGIFFP